MLKKLSFIILSLAFASVCLANTQAFVHTNRNGAKIENASKLFDKNNLAPATGLVVETKEGQRVSLVLSSKAVIDIVGKARIVIEEASQETPIVYNKENSYELKNSYAKVRIDYGLVYFSLPALRPSSKFEITSPLGTYKLDCRYFRIDVAEQSDKILIYEGTANFADAESSIKLNDAYISTISKHNTSIRLNTKRAALDVNESLEEQFKALKGIYEATHFSVGDTLKAQRVLAPSLRLESIKNNHHKN